MCNGTILVDGMVDVLVALVFSASVLGAKGDALSTRASRSAGMDARPPQEVRARAGCGNAGRICWMYSQSP